MTQEGWSNRETWEVHIYLTQDRERYSFIRYQAVKRFLSFSKISQTFAALLSLSALYKYPSEELKPSSLANPVINWKEIANEFAIIAEEALDAPL